MSKHNTISRRRFLMHVTGAAGATILAACGAPAADTGNTAPAPEPTAATAAEPTAATAAESTTVAAEPTVAAAPASGNSGTITFLNWDVVKDTPYEAVINAFQEQTGTKVEIQPTPTDQYDTKMRTLLASGTPPDIMRVNDDFVRGYSVENQFMELDQFMTQDNVSSDNYNAFILNFAKQPDGKTTALAIGSQPALIYYNVDMFKEAGIPLPPTTWTDENWKYANFLEAAKKLTVEGERWGALVYDDTSSETVFSVNNGEPNGIYSKDGTQFTLANPKAAEGIQWATDLTCVEKVQPDRSMLQADGAANQLFAGGKVGMMLRTFGLVPYLRKNVSDFTWDVTPPPGNEEHKTIGTLIVFCMPKTAANKEGAWELLKFMGGPEGGKIFAEAGTFIPIHKEASALIKPGDQPPAHMDLFVTALEHAVNENFSPNIERARSLYRPQMDLIYTCESKAADILNAAKVEVEQALAGDI